MLFYKLNFTTFEHDVFGPSITKRFGKNLYALVVLGDYSRYTWILFLSQKRDMFGAFRKLSMIIQNEKGLKIAFIKSDHGY